jgi:predicted NAD-dependent protein-ADP-ribosyltransferase YbiA (DUF1768 family)
MSAEPRMVSLEELAEWAVPNAAGEIAFFSRKRVDGQGYIHGPLSNGFIEPDGTFVEAEYQAYAKTVDPVQRERILAATRPFGRDGAKSLGRKVELRPDHARIAVPVMAFFVARKFREHPVLANFLIATADYKLIEGNDWHDDDWGDCRCGHERCAARGKNQLGVILMTLRAVMQEAMVR